MNLTKSRCGYANCDSSATKYSGVITNANGGLVSVSGTSHNSAILMQGTFGTLLNYGTLQASSGNYAISTDNTASGSLIVNAAGGVIDGQVAVAAGQYARFENSGWMGIGSTNASAPGVVNSVSGTFVQTSTGTLGLRVSPTAADSLVVNGTAVIGGALAVAATAGIYGAARYSLVNASGGLSGAFSSFTTNLTSATNLFYDANNAYLNVYAFTTAQTQQSLVNNVSALQGTYTLQNSVLVNSFTYDCSLFGANNICVSAGGRNTSVQAEGINNTSGLLIGAYRLNENARVGAYIDQNLSVSGPATVKLDNSTPVIGLFGVLAQDPISGTGWEGRLAATYGQKNATVQRSVVGTSESGVGSANLNSQGAQLVGKYGFGSSNALVVSPYVGMRYTQNNMGGYTEQTSSSVTAPLTYAALNTNATTALAGLASVLKVTPKATVLASVGIETDTSTSNGSYVASGINGLTPVNFNPNPVRARPTASIGAYYDIEKNQRIGINGIYRQEAYQAVSTTSVMATYTIGL